MVYIQARGNRLPHHFDVACALYGAEDTGQEVNLITYLQLESGAFDNLIPRHIFIGSVEFMTEVFKRMGLKAFPKIPVNSDREHQTRTLGHVRTCVLDGESLFVKPFQTKLFTGLVLDKITLSSLNSFPADLEVMVYPVIHNIISEWRIYVHEGKIVDSRNYSGDFTISPNYIHVQRNILPFCKEKNFPCAYTIDVAVIDHIETETTEVIEFNDMWAIGNYGIPNDLYYRLLKDRYVEIVKTRWDEFRDSDLGTKLTNMVI